MASAASFTAFSFGRRVLPTAMCHVFTKKGKLTADILAVTRANVHAILCLAEEISGNTEGKWSGLSESNRQLNLGKDRVVNSNALEWRHLTDLKEPLNGK
jgi:hypothetical protein